MQITATNLLIIFEDNFSYKIGQNMETDVDIADPRQVLLTKGSNGETVSYTASMSEPITITFSAIGVKASLLKKFEETFKENRFGRQKFILSMRGTDDFGGKIEYKYTGCVFQELPRQKALGQGISETSIMIQSCNEVLNV